MTFIPVLSENLRNFFLDIYLFIPQLYQIYFDINYHIKIVYKWNHRPLLWSTCTVYSAVILKLIYFISLLVIFVNTALDITQVSHTDT